jgi:DNA modification methylase
MTDWNILKGDVVDELRDVEDNTFDGCLCDPPYGFNDSVDIDDLLKQWLDQGKAEVSGSGFMNSRWDAKVPGPAIWSEIFRVLKPGANLMAFAAPKNQDLLGVSLRLAGFELRDCVMWQFGSGFPKSYNISKALDRKAGAEREVVGERTTPDGKTYSERATKNIENYDSFVPETKENMYKTAPATEEAKRFEGYGSALKPSYEPILVAQKPVENTFADNAKKWGVSGINIDDCRIPVGSKSKSKDRDGEKTKHKKYSQKGSTDYAMSPGPRGGSNKGRFPTNTVLSHHPECSVKCHEDCAVHRMDESSGDLHSDSETRDPSKKTSHLRGVTKMDTGENSVYTDTGGASRFFKKTDAPKEKWDCHEDCAVRRMDESSGERSAGGSVHKGTDQGFGSAKIGFSDAKDNSGFESYDDTGGASRFFYTSKAQRSEREAGLLDLKDDLDERVNSHPCIKPVDLIEYFATMILPPEREDDDRKLLQPFSGTGSEIIGSMLSGWDSITGIEREDEYVEIAEKRIDWWEEHGDDAVENHKSTKKRKKKEQETGQTNINDLFGD